MVPRTQPPDVHCSLLSVADYLLLRPSLHVCEWHWQASPQHQGLHRDATDCQALRCLAREGLPNQVRLRLTLRIDLTFFWTNSLVLPECDIASEWCQEQLQLPFLYGGTHFCFRALPRLTRDGFPEINPYDISKPCTTLSEDLCYPQTSVIKTYLDQPWVREKLGVEPGLGPFQSCSNKVRRRSRAVTIRI